MSHDIAFDRLRQRHMVMVAGSPPWHKLGQNVKDAQTWAQAIELAGLNWTVKKEALADLRGNILPTYGMFREGTLSGEPDQFLGPVGNVYQPIQNVQMFDFVDTLLSVENGAHYESAGALGNGERVWCLARVPKDITIAGTDDVTQMYLLFCSSHDGSLSAQIKLVATRVVCNNTLTAALGERGRSCVKIRHSASAGAKLAQAKRMMTDTAASVEDLEFKLNELAKRKMDRETFTGALDRIFPQPENDSGKASKRRENVLSDVVQLYESNDRDKVPEIRGTAYNLLNAITEYTDHMRGARITGKREGMSVDQARAENALFGTGQALKENALDIILEVTEGNERREIGRLYSTPSTPPPAPSSPAGPSETPILDSLLDSLL